MRYILKYSPAITVVTTAIVVLTLVCGSWAGFVDFCNGKRIRLDAEVIDLQTVESQPVNRTVVVRNISFGEVAILGLAADCQCYSTRTSFPINLGIREEVAIDLVFTPPGNAGDDFSRKFAILGDRIGERYLFKICGVVED
jgi:hypothetical protein